MNISEYKAYIALGDSMSIDLYPALDLRLDEQTPIGAASLLYRNWDALWPSFRGKDLSSKNPDLEFINLTEDGAVTWDLLNDWDDTLFSAYRSEPVLITLTIGGNDLLQLILRDTEMSSLMIEVGEVAHRLEKVVAKVIWWFPNATLILNSIYDPSDGNGAIPSLPNYRDKLPLLDYLNFEVKSLAAKHSALFADIHARFLGHGIGAVDSYYWQPSPIEPSALGASELRALWLDTLAPVLR